MTMKSLSVMMRKHNSHLQGWKRHYKVLQSGVITFDPANTLIPN